MSKLYLKNQSHDQQVVVHVQETPDRVHMLLRRQGGSDPFVRLTGENSKRFYVRVDDVSVVEGL